MDSSDIDAIDQQQKAWANKYAVNNDRGNENINFAISGNQWLGSAAGLRENANKESLTFNILLRYSRRLKAQLREIEFTLNLFAKNDGAEMQETNAFKMILDHIVLAKSITDKLEECGDKCIDYGYGFLEVNFERDNNQTLCKSPVVRVHQDPSIAFWDLNAQHPCKTDGRFCGIKKTLSRDELLEKYPDIENDSTWLKDQDNDVIDYWYRKPKKCTFVALKGGVYKNEDCLNEEDVLAKKNDFKTPKGQKKKDIQLEKTVTCSCIYFTRICNNEVIVDPIEFPSDRLPLIYHPGFTIWTDEGPQTYPFTHAMRGVQQLLNYTHSQLATMIKNASGRLMLVDHKHIEGSNQDDIKGINQREGVVAINMMATNDTPLPPPMILNSPDIPFALMEYSNNITQMADSVAGSAMDIENAQQSVISGKAIQEFTQSTQIMQVGFMASQIMVANETGACIKSMIPKLYTEERTLVVKRKDGTSQAIIINQYTPETNTVKNNIKDLEDNFIYEIAAGPSTTMQKQDTIKKLEVMIQADPNWLTDYGDIYARNLDFPDAKELERRLLAKIDPMLVKFSQNEISQQQFLTYQQKKMQPQQQMQMQHAQAVLQEQQAKASKLQNEGQAATLRAQTEQQKVQAIQQDVNIKGQTAISNAANQQANTQIQASKVMGEQQQRATQQSLDENHLQYEREKAVNEHVSNLVGHHLKLHEINQNAALEAQGLAQQQQQAEAAQQSQQVQGGTPDNGAVQSD